MKIGRRILKIREKKVPGRRFIYHISHMDYSGTEPGPPWSQASS
jgi:hypothetical protein